MAFQVDGKIPETIAVDYKVITPSDTTDQTMDNVPEGQTLMPRAFRCDFDGTVSILSPAGDVITLTVIKGVQYNGLVKRFRATGTTAGTIIALG